MSYLHVRETSHQASPASAHKNGVWNSPPSFFQPKLTVNTPGDAYEQEADRVADSVMRMSEGDVPVVQRMPITPVSGVQRKCANCEKEEQEQVQRKETTGGDPSGKSAPSIVSDVISSGGGQPMDGGTRQFMESRFGQDFGQVRIHTDTQAASSAKEVKARAYTVGQHIVFGSGNYQPESDSGRSLIAHELAHTVQQRNILFRSEDPLEILEKKDQQESEAEAASGGALKGERPSLYPVGTVPVVARQVEGEETPSGTEDSLEHTETDGRVVNITRSITPGRCSIGPRSSRFFRSGADRERFIFEMENCQGGTRQRLSGGIDYSDPVRRFGDVLAGFLNSGDPSRAIRDLETAVRAATPEANLEFTLQFSNLSIHGSGSASGNLDGHREFEVSGQIRYTNGQFTIEAGGTHQASFTEALRQSQLTTVTLNTDIGPLQIRLNGSQQLQGIPGSETETLQGTASITGQIGGGISAGVQAGGSQTSVPGDPAERSGNVLFIIGVIPRLPRETGPDCSACRCTEPRITYHCNSEREDQPGGEPDAEITRHYPLFFEYAEAEPRPDWLQRYQETISEIVQRLTEGYTIARIEGRTSPEGPQRRQGRGRFEGNIELAQSRATRARDDLRAAINTAIGSTSLLVMRPDERRTRLEQALSSVYEVVGHAPDSTSEETAELFGMNGGQEVEEADMFQHLSQALQVPADGQPNQLEREHLSGEGLPEQTQVEMNAALERFRTGTDGRRRLSEAQRLQQAYQILRRALITLEPPRPRIRPSDLLVTQEMLDRIERETSCSEEYKQLINRSIPIQSESLLDNGCDNGTTQ